LVDRLRTGAGKILPAGIGLERQLTAAGGEMANVSRRPMHVIGALPSSHNCPHQEDEDDGSDCGSDNGRDKTSAYANAK
jgi:hypothetical protein